jgi:UDP-N-acetylmuramoylalanine--D-glutamate ligase
MKQGRFDGCNVLVMGLGSFGGGIGAVRFLTNQGARITVTDLADERKLAGSIAQLRDLPITWRLGGHCEEDFTNADWVVVNPAVPEGSPWLKLIRDRNIPLTTEMNLFFQRCPAPIVGITGSNGKSTTSSMIAAILRAGQHGTAAVQYDNVWFGGNIGGESLLEKIDRISPNDLVVLELSSFQLYWLALIKKSPHIAVITNLNPNHLDWHGTMQAYEKAKQNIIRFQQPNDFTVLNRQDPTLKNWADQASGQVRWFPAGDVDAIKLTVPGRYNRLNAAAALTVADILGVAPNPARVVLKAYKALPHRLELVGEVDGVRYYNDSKSTTPDSALAALEAFSEKKVMILGGYDKKVSFSALLERMAREVDAVILIGQIKNMLAEQLGEIKRQNKLDHPVCVKADDFSQAVAAARREARPGSVVLLSPGCASYDMFRNYEDRGEQFRRLVLAMKPA